MANWIEGTVVDNVRWHDTLFSLCVEAPIKPFVAGQFTKLSLVVGEKRLSRAYSFVNGPDDPRHEFYLVEVADGGLSPRLAQLAPGESVFLADQPSGFFTLDEVPDASELWLLATGTAIGPYLSMLAVPELWQRFERICLVHGVRYQRDLSYQSLIGQYQARYPGRLSYLPMVTRESVPGTLAGRIPQAIAAGQLQRAAEMPLTPTSSQVMICGNPQMVKETQTLLTGMEFVKNMRRKPGQITTENYW